jgi:hypothetical protein
LITLGPSSVGWFFYRAAMRLSGFRLKPSRPPAVTPGAPHIRAGSSGMWQNLEPALCVRCLTTIPPGRNCPVCHPEPQPFRGALDYWTTEPPTTSWTGTVSQYVPGVGLVTAKSHELLQRCLEEIARYIPGRSHYSAETKRAIQPHSVRPGQPDPEDPVWGRQPGPPPGSPGGRCF